MRTVPRTAVPRAAAALACLLVWAGCAARSAPVAVPEQQFRSEEALSDRIALPLTAESRLALTRFLRAGGNRDDIGSNAVDPDAEARYKALLDLLQNPQGMTTADLADGTVLRARFHGKPERRVVDAREEAPVFPLPYALSDGRYWWVFFHQERKLTGVLVFKAASKRIED